jgi:alanine racemase
MKKIINKTALIHNATTIKNHLKTNNNAKALFVVKANAYGHGSKLTVKTLNNIADYYGVTNLKEAKSLVKVSIKPILILAPTFKLFLKSEESLKIEYAISSIFQFEKLENQIIKYENVFNKNNKNYKCFFENNQKINLHLKINIGMNRFGETDLNKITTLINKITSSKFFNLKAVFTHFPTLNDKQKSTKQIDAFFEIINNLKKNTNLPKNLLLHGGGSKLCNYNEKRFNMVRVGIALYGYELNNLNQKTNIHELPTLNLKPVMEIYAKIIEIQNLKAGESAGYDGIFTAKKQTIIAVVDMGYAQGLNKHLVNKWYVLINYQKAKIIAICMDFILIDMTNILKPKVGSKAIVLNETVNATLMAKKLKTISYEVLLNF